MGGEQLFDSIDLTISERDRIGLVGHNGCGKSTLLSLLAGRIEPDRGEVRRRRGLRLAEVEQFLPDALNDVALAQAVGGEAWQAEALLNRLGFVERDYALAVGALSGGQQNRLMFARAVVTEPDVLLLDEPTNHLDLATIVRFEEFLNAVTRLSATAFVLVSHDRAFLDAVTERTVFVRDKRLYSFAGCFSPARQELIQMDEAAGRARAAEERKIDGLSKSAKRLAIWGKVYDNAKFARRAKSMEHRIERLSAEKTFVTKGSPLRLDVEVGSTRGKEIVRVKDLDVGVASRFLFHIDEFLIRPGERVALLGPNGVGKSTFIKSLVRAEAEGDRGFIVSPQASFGYYDQELDEVESTGTMLEFAIDRVRERVSAAEQTVRNALIRAGFPYPVQVKRVSDMSGGERARLLFVVLSMQQPNFLVLDEPTNHIDIDGKEQLEEQLLSSGAAVLVTSHDRRFIETVAERFVWIRDGQLVEEISPRDFFASGDVWMGGEPPRQLVEHDAVLVDHDRVLERIFELEEKLEADRARKPKSQKPAMQASWEDELRRLYEMVD